MGNTTKNESIATIRSIIGQDFSDMDIIRSLHMANNDITAAINIIFDSPNFGTKSTPNQVRSCLVDENSIERNGSGKIESCSGSDEIIEVIDSDFRENSEVDNGCSSSSGGSGSEWWFVGSSELGCLSTCKGRMLKAGDELTFSFPVKNSKISSSGNRFPGRGRSMSACSEIVRLSTKDGGEIGRIPNEWARCLLPLVKDKKIRVEGTCKSDQHVLGIMDTIFLSVRIYINSSMFRTHQQTPVKSAHSVSDESVFHPLPTLFKLLGMTPFKKAEVTPEDLYTRKRPLGLKVA